MPYRSMSVEVIVADDQNLDNLSFNRKATIYKTVDLEAATPTLRVAPADSDTLISMGTVSNAKAVYIFSDYPVKVRFNGPSATQFTLNVANVPAVNVGAPLPAQCFLGGNFNVTSIYLAPITSAAQTANVWIACVGDPLSDY